MASTPPLRSISVREPPPTPRHGPKYDNSEPRYSTRSSQRIASREVKTTPEPQPASRGLRSARTPESQRLAAHKLQHPSSPPISPHKSPKHNSGKRVPVVSPSSPSTRSCAHDTSSSNPSFTSGKQQNFLTSSTIMSDGMLPTPVKTPRKKSLHNVNIAARALFQDKPNAGDEMMPTPKKNRKSRRHNGFSLESFSTDDGVNNGGIQVYTDSRDNVPELDMSQENPFVDHPSEEAEPLVKRVDGASKRRRLTTTREKDPQVEEAIQDDEGMVYVFRGKKMFKRFDDSSEMEETTIDPSDLGLLEHTGAGGGSLRLLRPLTRKSIKPTRLFQTEEQKQAREAEKAEETVTDIEEEMGIEVAGASVPMAGRRTDTRRSLRTVATKSAQSTDGTTANEIEDESQALNGGALPAVDKVKKPKRGSPFDSWRRVKSAATSATVTSGKGRKRASSVLEDSEPSTGRKLRNR